MGPLLIREQGECHFRHNAAGSKGQNSRGAGRMKIVIKADRPHLRDYSTHRQTPWTDNDSFWLLAALGDRRTDGRTDGRTQGLKNASEQGAKGKNVKGARTPLTEPQH